MFIRYLAEQSFNVVKSEKKPRRNIQYKDMGMELCYSASPPRLLTECAANAVARIDNLEFLADVIPRTTTYRQFKEKRAKEAVNGSAVEAGQTTLDGKKPQPLENGVNGAAGSTYTPETNGTHPPREMMPLHSPTTSDYPSILSPTNGTPIVDRTVDHIGHAHPSDADIEMAG